MTLPVSLAHLASSTHQGNLHTYHTWPYVVLYGYIWSYVCIYIYIYIYIYLKRFRALRQAWVLSYHTLSCQHVLRNSAARECELTQMSLEGLPMSQGELQNAVMEGRHGTLGGQNGVQMPPLRAPNGRLSNTNCEMELLGPPRWISRAARCANMAQQAIFGRIWGAQKGPKMGLS